MLEKTKKNKFEEAISELIRFCDECEHNKEKNGCPYNRGCNKFDVKFKELEYESLYPMHPCKGCLVDPMCKETCDKYIHHENMRDFAKSELQGHPNFISEEDLRQTTFNGESIEDIKNDPDYPEIMETEKQKYEHFYKDKPGKDENKLGIINLSNSTSKKQMKKAATTYISSDHLKLIKCFFS